MTYLTHLTDMTQSERKTRLELATYSLEGYRSTKWATSAYNWRLSIEDWTFRINAQFSTTNFQFSKNCGQRRIRTSVLVREQIYSLSPLATRPSAQVMYEAWNLNYKGSVVPTSDLIPTLWAEEGSRTPDLLITNQLLYQLSYFGF